MRIYVYPHDLDLGGSQLNAIEIGAAVRDLGHDVTVYGRPGALLPRIDELGLPFVRSVEPGRRPSGAVVRDLRSRIVTDGVDVVHGYEWPPALEARVACLGTGVTAVATVMSMAVAPFIPRAMPLSVGTDQIAAAERHAGRRAVSVVEPPVDIHLNRPGVVRDLDAFRRRHDIPLGTQVVVVGRLATELKLEGLLTAIAVVPTLASDTVLTVVGDGPARARVEAAAAAANARAGRRAVVLTGALDDPRPAYELADVALGMGGSALRAMAFATPLVVQGEQGFWSTLTPRTLGDFRWTGWYGVGDSPRDGEQALTRELRPLLDDVARRRALGDFARRTVVGSYSLEAAANHQVEIYRRAVDDAGARRLHPVGDSRAVLDLGAYKLRRVVARRRGRVHADDFNQAPVATATTPSVGRRSPTRLVYLPGVAWDGSEGTDRRLVRALAERVSVLWVDPPVSVVDRSHRRLLPLRHLWHPPTDDVAPGVRRLRVVGPPAPTRLGSRGLAAALTDAHVRRAVASLGGADVVVVANPLARFPSLPGAVRVHYVTDDWPAGAGLMGVSRQAVQEVEADNAAVADLRLAVSPALAARIGATHRVPVEVLANGCTTDQLGDPGDVGGDRRPTPGLVGLTGQINERLDLDLLEAVADRDLTLVLVGARRDRDPMFRRRLDRLLARPNVEWWGERPADEMPAVVAQLGVGLTPYALSAFNLASFPIKTLDYLAAGIACVATPSPALAWLGTDLVHQATEPGEFADLVVRLAHAPGSPRLRAQRREFARQHSWAARADRLLALAAGPLQPLATRGDPSSSATPATPATPTTPTTPTAKAP